MPGRDIMEKATDSVRQWIRKHRNPGFKADGPVPFELSLRWWPSDEGYTTLWLCTCGIADEANDDKDVVLVGEFDDGPAKDADKRFHVDQLDLPGGSSWEIDAMLNAPLKVLTSDGAWTPRYITNLATIVNAFLWISTENVEKNGINASGVLAGRLVPQDIDADKANWDHVNGPCPEHRWYYRPWGTWHRGQTGENWNKTGWLKPIPLFGQFIDPEAVSDYTDVDVDMDGNVRKV
jgi:hypothetical protein